MAKNSLCSQRVPLGDQGPEANISSFALSFPGTGLIQPHMDLPTAFRYFDTDGNGYLTTNEVINILTMQSGGAPMSLQDAQAFVANFDQDGNGALDYNEFCNAMMAMQPPPPQQQPAPMAMPMAMGVPLDATPMAQAVGTTAEPSVPCKNGILFLNGRVQTQWDDGDDCDYRYYLGNVTAINGSDTATITYDDGDVWTGETKWMYCVNDIHPGYARSDHGVGYASLDG